MTAHARPLARFTHTDLDSDDGTITHWFELDGRDATSGEEFDLEVVGIVLGRAIDGNGDDLGASERTVAMLRLCVPVADQSAAVVARAVVARAVAALNVVARADVAVAVAAAAYAAAYKAYEAASRTRADAAARAARADVAALNVVGAALTRALADLDDARAKGDA